MDSSDILLMVLVLGYFIGCGWEKYVEHRWPKPEAKEDE